MLSILFLNKVHALEKNIYTMWLWYLKGIPWHQIKSEVLCLCRLNLHTMNNILICIVARPFHNPLTSWCIRRGFSVCSLNNVKSTTRLYVSKVTVPLYALHIMHLRCAKRKNLLGPHAGSLISVRPLEQLFLYLNRAACSL